MSEKGLLSVDFVVAKDLESVVKNAIFSVGFTYEDMCKARAEVTDLLSQSYDRYNRRYNFLIDKLYFLKRLEIFTDDYIQDVIDSLYVQDMDFLKSLRSGGVPDAKE